MLHVATVLLAFVAVSGARPSLEWGWLSRRKKLSPEEKLEEWRMKDGGRFSGRCSFWGASWGTEGSAFDDPDGECTCRIGQNLGELSRECMLPLTRGETSFSPAALLESYPDAQLWAVNCSCVPDSSPETPEILPPPEDADLIRVAAVDFCAAFLKNFDDMFDRSRHGIVFKDRSTARLQAIEGLDASKCAESLEDVEKAKIAKGNGSMYIWQTALRHVCHKECEEIVDEMKRRSREILFSAGDWRQASYSEACSLFVVRKVESHILGCCGDSCGWDGAKCALERFRASTLSKFL